MKPRPSTLRRWYGEWCFYPPAERAVGLELRYASDGGFTGLVVALWWGIVEIGRGPAYMVID